MWSTKPCSAWHLPSPCASLSAKPCFALWDPAHWPSPLQLCSHHMAFACEASQVRAFTLAISSYWNGLLPFLFSSAWLTPTYLSSLSLLTWPRFGGILPDTLAQVKSQHVSIRAMSRLSLAFTTTLTFHFVDDHWMNSFSPTKLCAPWGWDLFLVCSTLGSHCPALLRAHNRGSKNICKINDCMHFAF